MANFSMLQKIDVPSLLQVDVREYEEMQLQILCNPLIEFRTRQDSID